MDERDRSLDVRRAGVLLHITSLPASDAALDPNAPGDLGDAAYRFVDFLADAGCSVWQVLPLVPTHGEDASPYNAPSAMAGNARLISARLRRTNGLDEPGAL
jgi:4-alpha-glucanotransferase